jgi:MoaA/NifB/PqqE/SkfB family radical SAM enzyme
MRRVVRAIIEAAPKRVSFSGGEPLSSPWWEEAAGLLSEANIPVTLFTSGWLGSEEIAQKLKQLTSSVVVSIDGPNESVHDAVRNRPGSYVRAVRTLSFLNRLKENDHQLHSEFTFGIDYTVVRSNQHGLQEFVKEMTSRFPKLDFIRFGAAIPCGVAQEESFERTELLSDEEMLGLINSAESLSSAAFGSTNISVTDIRYFLPNSPERLAGETMAHIEADGQLRAFCTYEAKVGSVLDEPMELLWKRAIAWRKDPVVSSYRSSITSLAGWAKVTRILDRTYGSAEDKQRIAKRRQSNAIHAPLLEGV